MTFKMLILACFLCSFVACGEGVETGSTEPLKDVAIQLTSASGEQFVVTTDANGKGIVYQYDADGQVKDQVTIEATVDADGFFSKKVTFSDGMIITVSGTVTADGDVANATLQINGVNANASVAPLTTADSNVVTVLGVSATGILITPEYLCDDETETVYTTASDTATFQWATPTKAAMIQISCLCSDGMWVSTTAASISDTATDTDGSFQWAQQKSTGHQCTTREI